VRFPKSSTHQPASADDSGDRRLEGGDFRFFEFAQIGAAPSAFARGGRSTLKPRSEFAASEGVSTSPGPLRNRGGASDPRSSRQAACRQACPRRARTIFPINAIVQEVNFPRIPCRSIRIDGTFIATAMWGSCLAGSAPPPAPARAALAR